MKIIALVRQDLWPVASSPITVILSVKITTQSLNFSINTSHKVIVVLEL